MVTEYLVDCTHPAQDVTVSGEWTLGRDRKLGVPGRSERKEVNF